MKRVLSSTSSVFLSPDLQEAPTSARLVHLGFFSRIRRAAGGKSIGNRGAGARGGVFVHEGHLKNKGPDTPAENKYSGQERSRKRNFFKALLLRDVKGLSKFWFWCYILLTTIYPRSNHTSQDFTNILHVGSTSNALWDSLVKHLKFLVNIPAPPHDTLHCKVVKLKPLENLIS